MKRSKHKLSHYRLASFDMGQLVPVGLYEVLPGDTVRQRTSALLRITPLVNPLMHPVSVRIHHFYVPSRVAYQAWRRTASSNDTWEEWINKNSNSSTLKQQAITNVAAGDLMNHLGLPALNGISMNVNILPLIGYNMIFNEFYRDQELTTELSLTQTTLQRIAWEKDYFTSARTNPQYDSTTMSIPFDAGTAPVLGISVRGTAVDAGDTFFDAAGTQFLGTDGAGHLEGFDGSDQLRIETETTGAISGSNKPVIYTDLGSATGGIDVNDFRRALALQKFLEARSRYGHRYRDYLRYLGVRSRDGRLEEPEYLGGGKQTVAFSEVISTAEGTNTEVGSLAGHGIAAIRTRPFTRFIEEHGFVYSLISVRPKAMYQESMHRHWFRDTRDDIWQKEYEAFGPQAILDKEVYAAHANETDVFGYQDRFQEYREHPSGVSGLFSTTDDDWHMAREFGSSPSLNSSFVTCTPTDRIYADTGDSECRVMCSHSIVARRLVSQRAR